MKKKIKNSQPQTKFTGSYIKKSVMAPVGAFKSCASSLQKIQGAFTYFVITEGEGNF